MNSDRQKIPLILKLKRMKNSKPVRKFNAFVSSFFPPKKYNGIPGKILIFRNDRIGDAVVTLPVLRDIKLNYPSTKIDIVTSKVNEFLFVDSPYIDSIIDIKLNGNETSLLYKLPLFGGLLLSFKYLIIPFITSKEHRLKLSQLKKQKYDLAIDLVGLKRNSMIANYASSFSAGPGRLFPFLFYDYYSETNWVSPEDNDFMTRKLEKFIENSSGIRFTKRDTTSPITNEIMLSKIGDKYDIIFHFGAPELRKMEYDKEKALASGFTDKKILITDSYESATYIKLKKDIGENTNVRFKLFPTLYSLAEAAVGSTILFCYDGGQSHFLSQYLRTVTLFGPGSPHLWKPYEYSDYKLFKQYTGNVRVMESAGKLKHIMIYIPIWCNPCFDTGCQTRPCLNNIGAELVIKVIKENLDPNNAE